MTRNAASGGKWVKSSFSYANGECVEVQLFDDGSANVRNSRDPHGPVLRFTPGEWDSFARGVKNGEFDRRQVPSDASGCGNPNAAGGGSSPGTSGPLTTSNQA